MRGPRAVMKSGPRSPELEKALTQKRRPNTAKNKKINKIKKKKKKYVSFLSPFLLKAIFIQKSGKYEILFRNLKMKTQLHA